MKVGRKIDKNIFTTQKQIDFRENEADVKGKNPAAKLAGVSKWAINLNETEIMSNFNCQ